MRTKRTQDESADYPAPGCMDACGECRSPEAEPSDARFRQMAAAVEDVLYCVNGRTGEFEYLSPAFERMFGYTTDDVARLGGREAFLATVIQGRAFEEQLSRFAALRRSAVPGAALSWESWWRCKNGALKFIEDRWIPVLADGVLQSTCGVLRDETERKRAEEALCESERRLQALGDNIPGGALYQLLMPPGGDNRYTYLSAGFERIFGLPVDRILADPAAFYELVLEEDRARLMAEEARCAREMAVFDFEFRQRTASGEVKWIHACSTPRRLPDGSLLWDGVAADITARKRVEEALRESVERNRLLIECAQDGVAIADAATGTLLDCNPALCRLAGRERAELVGRPQSVLHPPHQLVNGLSPSFRAQCEDEAGLAFEDDLLARDGQLVPVEIRASRLRLYGRDCLMGVFRDITERRQAKLEAELQLEFLREAHVIGTERELAETFVRFAQRRSGCEAVGIRLRDGDDYPYYEARGFPQEFLRVENSLCIRDEAGRPLRDRADHVLLECMCGNVICGRFDPAKPFFTAAGSFWSNDTTRLLATTTPADRQAHTRNRCNGEGYESVALIPLVSGTQRLGLLQLNDRRKGMFTLANIALWERVAGYFAVALTKCRAEEALRASEATYFSLFENMMNSVVHARMIFDGDRPVDMEYLACNPAFVEVTGIRAPVVGRRISEVIPGYCERNPESLQTFGRVAATGIPARWEHFLPELDRWFSFMIYSPARGEVIIITENCTERKRAEAALRESEERFRSLIEGAPEGIYVQCEGVFQYANRAMLKMLGVDRSEDLLGLPLLERIAPEFREAVLERIRKQREEGAAALPMEQEYLRLDGTRIAVETEAVPIRFRERNGHLVFLRDITTRRKAKAERELLEAQLRQAQKLESVGRLAGGVAHDFNNLLMSIMGHAELCCDILERGHAARADLDEIMDAAQRSAGITRQLLAFARQQAVTPVVLDVNDHVSNTLKLLQRLIGENIRLIWRPDARRALVKMDPSQLDQLLVNLVVNARDAINGVGEITVGTDGAVFNANDAAKPEGAAPGLYVVLAVSDTGCGMDEETLEHIFEPFFTTKPVGQGTGLGLATVYGIVKQNQGAITVQSEPGKGSAFRIYIRRQAEQAEQEEPPIALKAVPGGTETILLVEDERSVRTVTAAFLQKLGYTVLASESPAEALRLSSERGVSAHLLITDVVMPGMSGRELAAKLSESCPDMKSLLISGYPDMGVLGQGVLDDEVHFLAKPFSRDALARKVRDVLSGRGSTT